MLEQTHTLSNAEQFKIKKLTQIVSVLTQCLLRAAECRVRLHHCTVQLSARHTQMWITVRKKEYSTPTKKNWAGLLCNQNLKASRKSCSCT